MSRRKKIAGNVSEEVKGAPKAQKGDVCHSEYSGPGLNNAKVQFMCL